MANERTKRRSKTTGDRRAIHGGSLQYGALPYRERDGLELLLITSRGTGRWVLPKGWPMKGKAAHAAAAQEALEEAGLKGKVGRRPLGAYSYDKQLTNGALLACRVEVYPMAVERQLKRWREQAQRTAKWFKASEAADAVQEPELASLIEAFAAARTG